MNTAQQLKIKKGKSQRAKRAMAVFSNMVRTCIGCQRKIKKK